MESRTEFDLNRKYKDAYAVRRKRQLIATVPIFVVVIAASMFRDNRFSLPDWVNPRMLPFIFLGSIIGILIFSFKNWRCPKCDKYLGRALNPKFCTECGTQLRD